MAEHPESAIAIVGMAGRFPGAPDLDRFWSNLKNGVESVSFFTPAQLRAAGLPDALLFHPDFVPARAILDDAEDFDAGFFRMSPREAQITDPQHRVFLEECWNALEDAGIDPAAFDGAIGVFGGCSANTYMLNNLMSDPAVLDSLGGITAVLGSDKDHLATRVAYKLDLRGPALTVQTACSTSLVAVHLAMQSLLSYECDAALAGGVSVAVPIRGGHVHRAGDILSDDGHCRAFDARATGTVSGDGVGLVVLRRLQDALADGDAIRAVLLGSGTNNDGARKVGYTAPSVDGQAQAIAMAHTVGDVDPATIGYVEAHGTGTSLGDPVEVAALTQAFGDVGRQTVALGSVKSNIGHLNSAAGVSGLIKAVLAMEHGTVPPSLHFERANPEIGLENTPFFVVAREQPWPAGRPRAAVSSFGAGGTNAHVVLEPPPRVGPGSGPGGGGDASVGDETGGAPALLRLSARTDEALDARSLALSAWLRDGSSADLSDLAWTLAAGRQPMTARAAVVARDRDEASRLLADPADPAWVHGRAPRARRVAFAFPAQGHQQPGMGRALYGADPVFARELDRCRDRVRQQLDFDLFDLVWGDSSERLDDQLYAGPALFSIGWSLAQAWIARGVAPDLVIGHSTGEYVAAAVCGLLTFEEAFDLFMERARLMATLPDGGVLHVPLPAAEVEAHLVDGAWLALVNSPHTSVVTGTPEAIDAVEGALAAQEVECRRVRVSVPAHCPLLNPIAAPLGEAAKRTKPKAPAVPMISGITGALLTEADIEPDYWVRHLLQPVRFDLAVPALLDGDVVVLELGPPRCMAGLIGLNDPDAAVVSSLPPEDHEAFADPDAAGRHLLRAHGWLWAEGGPAPECAPARKVHLPGYPFQRQRYWIDAAEGRGPALANVGAASRGTTAGHAGHASHAGSHASVAGGSGGAAGPSSTRRKHPRPALDTPYVAPRDATEAELARICGDLLGIDGIGVHDGFFALGGDSLITLRLISKIEEELGQKLPPVAAFRGLTIGQMAKHVKLPEGAPPGGAADPPSSAAHPPVEPEDEDEGLLVPLRTTGTRPPLFMPPPAAGVIFPYFELARELGEDQPVYCIQSKGLDGETPPDLTVRAMAERYVRIMRTVQPHGPYYVGGYSFACYISLEMAHVLEEQGERAAHLILIDEVAPIDANRPRFSHAVRLTMGRAGRTFWKHAHDLAWLGTARARREEPGPIRQRIPDWMGEKWTEFVSRSAMSEIIPQDSHVLALDQPAIKGMGELFFLHIYETYAYNPPPWHGHGTLFKSDWWYDRPFFDRGHREEELGWEKLVTAGLDVRRGSGDHLAIMRQPHVQVLAREITAALEAAYRREGVL